ncbi:MAG: L-fuculose-phosphate aldolase [Lachnospiraceae bacterium]|nr:L-fuculose-phosphate aldolase [Lachnospiraceae bacterium]
MLLLKEREQVVAYCKKLITAGLTKGTGGNISAFDRESGLYAISPSGMDYFSMTPEDVVVMNLQGEVVEGSRKPSSEWDLHRIFYQNRKDLNAIVHTHSVYCTVLATNREGLPASSYLVAFAGKDVRCADYASFGTPELAKLAYEGMVDRNAVLLANHGLVTGGSDLLHAFQVAEQIEFCAEVYVKARSIGKPVILPEDEMERMIERFGDYGQKE